MCLSVSAPESFNGTFKVMQKRCRDVPSCQVLGCSTDLTDAKMYYQRKYICPVHMQADAVHVIGSQKLLRFCFQCGKLQDLLDFDANKRSCRRRLELRRNIPRNKRGGNSRSLCGSATDALAASAAASTDCELTEQMYECSLGLHAAISNAAALEELLREGAAALSPPCDPCQKLLQPASPQRTMSVEAGAAGSSTCKQGAWNASSLVMPAVPTAPQAFQLTGGYGQHSLMGFEQLVPQAAAASSGAVCWPPCGSSSFPAAAAGCPAAHAAAAAPAAAPATVPDFGNLQLPLLEDLLSEGMSDADSLQLVLESELTAAALDAAIASRDSAPLDFASQQLSQHLAAVLVQDSGLFGPSTSTQPMQGFQHGHLSCTMPMHGACMGPAGPAAGALYSQHSVVASTVSCSSSMNFGAKNACSSPAGTCWGATGVLGPCMPCPGQLMGHMPAAPACSGDAMPAQAAAVVDYFVQPVAQLVQVGVANMGCAVGTAGPSVLLSDQAARITQLRLQMVDLQSRVAEMRQQFGL